MHKGKVLCFAFLNEVYITYLNQVNAGAAYVSVHRGIGSSFGLVRQLNIGQANVPGWAG